MEEIKQDLCIGCGNLVKWKEEFMCDVCDGESDQSVEDWELEK